MIDPKDEVQTELRPILGVPPAVQDYRAEGSGALVDDRNAGEGLKFRPIGMLVLKALMWKGTPLILTVVGCLKRRPQNTL